MKELEFIDEAPIIIGAYIKDYKLWEDTLINHIIECDDDEYNKNEILASLTVKLYGLDKDDWSEIVTDLRWASRGRRKLLAEAKASASELKATDVFKLNDEMMVIGKHMETFRNNVRYGFEELIKVLLKGHLGEI